MKTRIFLNMDDAVFRIVIETEDWSEGDVTLMEQYGEPEINVGGQVDYMFNDEQKSKTFGDQYVKVMNGFPFAMGFDSRDYESAEEARAVGIAWKEIVVGRLRNSVIALRENKAQLPTEEISEI